MDSCQGSHKFTTLYCLRRVNVMHVRILFANPSHNANSVTEFDFLWRANANANFVLLILRSTSFSSHSQRGWKYMYMYNVASQDEVEYIHNTFFFGGNGLFYGQNKVM